jgi:hypothetical protein
MSWSAIMKANIQKEQRTAYWQYIEKMICNIPVDDDKTPTSSKFPKIGIGSSVAGVNAF